VNAGISIFGCIKDHFRNTPQLTNTVFTQSSLQNIFKKVKSFLKIQTLKNKILYAPREILMFFLAVDL
jgi:hypothetical protein